MPTRLTYVGHATVLIDLDGVRLLTDPVLRPRVMHLRRATPVPPDAHRGIDAVLVSHGHWDHLDLPSLDRLGREMPIVCPRGLGGLLRKRRFENVLELAAGEELHVGGLSVTATPADHDGGRGPLGVSASPVGFVVSGSMRIYFPGDTDLFAGMSDLAPLDVALLPVSGWGSKVGPGHLDPARAAEALALLRPRVAVPIHWGTLAPMWASPDPEPPRTFARLAAEIAPDVEVRIVEPGAELTLDEPA
jgi:L-ascorbate metabolism protein UlaG (beta-lactamase superfamily)